MRQRSAIFNTPDAPTLQPLAGGSDKMRLIVLRTELRGLDKEIKQLRDEQQEKLSAKLEARDYLVRQINALES
jgi:hypothetical protein